jgi:FG-GAP-like repeat
MRTIHDVPAGASPRDKPGWSFLFRKREPGRPDAGACCGDLQGRMLLAKRGIAVNVRVSVVAVLASVGLSACFTAVGEPQADAGGGPAACAFVGGHCVVGPPANCNGTILAAYDCNPPPRNPAGAVCCLPPNDAGMAPKCTIGGTNYADGDLNPMTQCQICQPALNPNGWTDLPLGSPCVGAGFCSNGVCDQGCLIDGGVILPGTIDTGGCQSCQPFVTKTGWSRLADGTPCPKGGSCQGGGCLPSPGCIIDGASYWKGTANPGDPSQCCSPATSAIAWSSRLRDGGTYQADRDLTGIAVADFNGDGVQDVALFSWGGAAGTGAVNVFLGRNDGAFGPLATYPTNCADSWGLGAGDLNGDGFPDIVVSGCNTQGSGIAVLMNRADGTGAFAPVAEQEFSVVLSSDTVLLRDFDGDRVLDLALAGIAAEFLKGVGDGRFESPISYNTPRAAPASIATGVFRDAGALDLVTANGYDDSVSLLFGDGMGEFVTGPTITVPTDPSLGKSALESVAVGDFNGDGPLDLAVGGASGFTVLPGNGDGTFASPLVYGSGHLIRFVTLADLDGDGSAEILGTSSDTDGGLLMVLWHTAGGGVSTSTLRTGLQSLSVVSADLNGDGTPDVVVGSGDGLVNIFTSGCP